MSGSPQAVGLSRKGMRGLVEAVGEKHFGALPSISWGGFSRVSQYSVFVPKRNAVGIVTGIGRDPPEA